MPESVTLRAVAAGDLPPLLAWRNHPAVRVAMFSQHEITPEEHRTWYARVSADPTRCLLVAEDAAGLFGFMQFGDVAPQGVANWGFYIRPGAPKGSGTRLCAAALDHAFGTLDLHKVCGQVITGNAASLALHRRLGFIEEGILRDQKYVNGTHHSLMCFGMLYHEWRSPPPSRSP